MRPKVHDFQQYKISPNNFNSEIGIWEIFGLKFSVKLFSKISYFYHFLIILGGRKEPPNFRCRDSELVDIIYRKIING
jgi:hypothetical protein